MHHRILDAIRSYIGIGHLDNKEVLKGKQMLLQTVSSQLKLNIE